MTLVDTKSRDGVGTSQSNFIEAGEHFQISHRHVVSSSGSFCCHRVGEIGCKVICILFTKTSKLQGSCQNRRC